MSYEEDLKKGKIERSNLEANKAFLEKTGLLKKGIRILEVGCGAGSMTSYLHSKGFDTIGTDVSELLLDYAKNNHPECRFRKMSGDKIGFKDNSFDMVISFDVLEHIPNVEKHISEVRRVLKKGGYYLFQTPNKWTNLPYCILKDRSFTKYKSYHPSLQTRNTLKSLLKKGGFNMRMIDVDISNDFMNKKIGPLSFLTKLFRTNLYIIARVQKSIKL